MLQLKSISKQYKTGDLVQDALKDVTLNLRDNEFVSILGPSGSGKTTLLNIIGGLDRYDSGDLIINGTSTKKYKDADWDTYRNHSIGFVFQSYNLIPHQSILSNVQLALTISGLSKSECRKRAKKALGEVGLGDQLHKKPNQMSGGQMQRVAIARALVNNPDILLADEPTGALDTETSVQVMELLKQVANNRLVVMVTHNSELAEEFSTRIVKLRDGKVVEDSHSYNTVDTSKTKSTDKTGKARMSFLTSLSLSFNNLRSKKGRTILTSLAGSIGIIGIALILALSGGVNAYIGNLQKDTMASYPITISETAIDMEDMMSMGFGMTGNMLSGGNSTSTPLDEVYSNHSNLEASQSTLLENNLTAFKDYLDDPDSDIQEYIGENGIIYSYNVAFDAFSYDSDGKLVNTSADTSEITGSNSSGFGSMMDNMNGMSGMGGMTDMFGGDSSGAENFSELMAGIGGKTVSQVVTDNYDVLYGVWPEEYNEVVIVLDENNAVPTDTLYQLGLITAKDFKNIVDAIAKEEEPNDLNWSYEDVCGHTFYMIPASDYFIENEDGTFSYAGDSTADLEKLVKDAVELKVTGVIRPNPEADNASISTAVAYTSKLTDYIIEHNNNSAIVVAQEKTLEINVLSGMKFEAANDEQKAKDAIEYIAQLGISDKASLFQMIMYYSSMEEGSSAPSGQQPEGQSGAGYEAGGMSMDESAMAAALDNWVKDTPNDEILIYVYDEYVGGSTYENNMTSFGKVSYDAPTSINIYTDSFEDKDKIAECIKSYNNSAGEDAQITYTDMVALMTSSLTSIVDVISYVLIAFVAVALVVSCIMIGIITHISVLERTKEIGILRALGASKRNISQVFNAETLIVGLCSGLLGVGVAMLLTIPLNALIGSLLSGISISASVSPLYGGILIALSVVITVLGGLLPAKRAAKKDPVTALRTE